jgi:hypothetical protein
MMDDIEIARKLCAYEGPLFGIVHMTDEQRIAREDLLLAAFAAIREECAKVAETYRLEAGEGNQITLSGFVGRRIAEAIRTAQPEAINVPGLGRLTESPEGEWTDEAQEGA